MSLALLLCLEYTSVKACEDISTVIMLMICARIGGLLAMI
nr:MAG TPA: hypothetical protein [Caudoviricetes sp.]DAO44796.1 MAG TPA: hypothetical protein [Caudoviricetes sp.]